MSLEIFELSDFWFSWTFTPSSHIQNSCVFKHDLLKYRKIQLLTFLMHYLHYVHRYILQLYDGSTNCLLAERLTHQECRMQNRLKEDSRVQNAEYLGWCFWKPKPFTCLHKLQDDSENLLAGGGGASFTAFFSQDLIFDLFPYGYLYYYYSLMYGCTQGQNAFTRICRKIPWAYQM